MNTRPRDNQQSILFREAESITKMLKEASKADEQAWARCSIWNKIFFDAQILPVFKTRDHFNNILRRHLIGVTDAQRFVFELAVYLIDLPEAFIRTLDLFPYPYQVAGKLAFRAVINSIRPTPPDAKEKFLRLCQHDMPIPSQQLLEALEYKKSDVDLDSFLARLKEKVPKPIFEGFLSTRFPQERLKYSIKYGCLPPPIDLDLSTIEMPFEFVQAIADIEGLDVAQKLTEESEEEDHV